MTPEDGFHIFVRCETLLAHKRPEPTTNFVLRVDRRTGRRFWTEVYASGNRPNGDNMTSLVGDELFDPSRHSRYPTAAPDGGVREVRQRAAINCRRADCGATPVRAQENTLFDVLDGFATAGVTVISLALLSQAVSRKRPV